MVKYEIKSYLYPHQQYFIKKGSMIMKKFYAALLAFLLAFSAFPGFIPASPAYAATGYHAYMGIQTNNTLWVFRNAYDDAAYGYGTDAFGGLHSVDGQKNLVDYPGTFTDASLTKDGTYTVTLDNPDFSNEKTLSQLFVSTDIPMVDSIKVTDVIVKIDGKTVYTFKKGILNPESYTYVQIMCLNIWNADVKALFPSDVPVSKCEITFTISGLEKAAAAQEAVKGFPVKMAKDHAIINGYTGSDTTVTIPAVAFGKNVTEIGANAFQKLSIKEIKLPDTVTKIGKYAFAGTKLTSVTIPKNVTSIGDGAFASIAGCTQFTAAKGNTKYAVKDGVLFSADLKTLVQYPAGKSGSSYTVPGSVTAIQGGAFEGCTKLTKITISDKVGKIGTDAFKGDSKLTIYAPSGSAAYNYAVKQGIKVKKN